MRMKNDENIMNLSNIILNKKKLDRKGMHAIQFHCSQV